jgi:hypothetical protein
MGDTLGDLWARRLAAANAAMDREERCLYLHGYGCARAECGRAPVRSGAMYGLAEFLPTSDPGRSIAPVNPQHQDEEHGG